MNFAWLNPVVLLAFGKTNLPPPAPVPTITNPASTAALNAAEGAAAGAQGSESNNVAGMTEAYNKRQLTAGEMSKRGKASDDLLY